MLAGDLVSLWTGVVCVGVPAEAGGLPPCEFLDYPEKGLVPRTSDLFRGGIACRFVVVPRIRGQRLKEHVSLAERIVSLTVIGRAGSLFLVGWE